jgi:hypothetical protein
MTPTSSCFIPPLPPSVVPLVFCPGVQVLIPVVYSYNMYIFEHEIGAKIANNRWGQKRSWTNRAQILFQQKRSWTVIVLLNSYGGWY